MLQKKNTSKIDKLLKVFQEKFFEKKNAPLSAIDFTGNSSRGYLEAFVKE